MKITAYKKEPGKVPEQIQIKNTVEVLQAELGGWYEVMRITKTSVVLINSDDNDWQARRGKRNCKFLGRVIYGPLIFMGVRGEQDFEFADAPISFKEFKRIFPDLWEKTNGDV